MVGHIELPPSFTLMQGVNAVCPPEILRRRRPLQPVGCLEQCVGVAGPRLSDLGDHCLVLRLGRGLLHALLPDEKPVSGVESRVEFLSHLGGRALFGLDMKLSYFAVTPVTLPGLVDGGHDVSSTGPMQLSQQTVLIGLS